MTIPTEVAAALAEMRDRKVNHGKHTSPTLIDWADRIESALTKAEDLATTRDVELAEILIEQIAPYATNGRQYVVDSETAPVIVDALRCYAHAPPAEPVASVPDGFYLASFKHKDRGGAMMWWGPDNAGYTPDIEHAGIYTEITPGYHDSDYTVPVPVSFLAGCRIRRTLDPGDSKNRAFWSASDLRAAVATNQEGAAP